jgi:hypothetical protein
MGEWIAILVGEVLMLIEEINFWKKIKKRRKFEKENNLPKKLMIHPVIKLFGFFLILILLPITWLLSSKDKGIKQTTQKISEIEFILKNEKETFGIYPKNLKEIIRNKPIRKNIIFDCWNNEFSYKQGENGLSYLLISKGKDGILKTEDDIKLLK